MSRRAVAVLGLVALGLVALAVVVKLVSEGSDSATVSSRGSFASLLSRAMPAQAPFEGLTEVRGAIGGRCLRLAVADSEAERVAGLRGHAADLGPYGGMVFVFPGPSQVGFTMSDVDDPLDIAFFDGSGQRVSSHAMPACPHKAESQCPVYRAGGPFVFAVETRPGGLPSGPLTACSPA